MRGLCLIALLSIGASPAAPSQLTSAQFREDFNVFCSKVQATYAYLDVKATRWDSVAAVDEPEVSEIRTPREFVELPERAIAELYDDHAHLTVNTPTYQRSGGSTRE